MLCLIAQLGALAHLLLVRHERCAEHGEVTHRVEAAPAAHAVAASPSAILDAGDPRSAHEEGDHCQWLAEHRAAAPAVSSFAQLVPQVTRAECALPALAFAAPRSLYRLAPKLSPPSAT